MRSTTRLPIIVVILAALVVLASSAQAATIEAVKGKHYKLTKRHGPWMIMVASFSQPPEDRRGEGMSAEEAAQELVYELRCHHIPAYVFRQEEVEEQIKVPGRRTVTRTAKIRNWTGGICVLAGNYPASNDKTAQQTLKFIKKFDPQFLSDVESVGEISPGHVVKRSKSGGLFNTTPDRPRPLSGAFMTTNPLLTDEDLALRRRDPMILKLNSGSEYSLLTNKGRYSVVVATFQGRDFTQLSNQVADHQFSLDSPLSEAGERAWELCSALRHARSIGYDREFEAYVYHDRYSSIVTVGSFDSKDDPRIVELQNFFGAKVNQVKMDGTPAIGAEAFTIPHPPRPGEPVKTFIFDPYPELIEVPR